MLGELYPYSFFSPQWISKKVNLSNGRHRDYGGYIEQGNYILSKYPIKSAENRHYLYNYRFEIDHTNFSENDHPHSVTITDIEIQNKILTILNLHGCYSQAKIDTGRSLKQSNFLIKITSKINNALLLVGEFNVAPETESIKILNNTYDNMIDKYIIEHSLSNNKGNLETKKSLTIYLLIKKSNPMG